MKKKIFTLLTLLVACVTGAWASTVDDLVTISSNYTFIADNVTANGTTGLSKNTLYDGNRIFSPLGNSCATNKGSSTIDGVSHYNSLRVKNNTQDVLAFKVGGPCTVIFYVQTTGKTGSEARPIKVGNAIDANTYGAITDVNEDHIVNITAAGVVYLTGTGDRYIAGFKVVFPKPEITTQPVSASYQKDAAATALSVAATASKGDLSYQWYGCDDANKTNAAVIDGATSASYTPSTSTLGTFYYFCRVTDDNGSSDSNVATITVANAYAPIVTPTSTSVEVYQNETANLGVTVDAVPVATIQWYSCDDALKTNPVAIVGATNTTYSPSSASAGTFYFYAVATNSEGSTASDVVTLTVNSLFTVTYSIGEETGVTGTVPASEEVSSSVTLPKNQTLYKEGYTLTGWNDGSTTRAPGATATITSNTTMTAVFTANTGELGVCPATVTWQFQTEQGAPTWAYEGDAAFKYVTQMVLGNETIDMPLTMDPSSGKIANANWTDWTQMNSGTKLTVPAVKGAELTLYVYQEGSSAVTFNGSGGAYSSNIYSYTATAADETTGSVQIVIGDQSYIKYLTVTYPTVGVKVYDYATSVGTGISGNAENVTNTTQSINGATVNVVKLSSTLNKDHSTYYWKITPEAGIFHKGDRIVWTGCYSNGSTKTTSIVIYDNDDDFSSSPIATGESFANVYGGSSSSPKAQTSGYFTMTADAKALYIGRNGGTTTFLTALSVVRDNATIKPTNNMSTYVASTALDFSGVAGLKAYKASAASAGQVTLEEVTIVPTGTPIVLIGTADTEYSVPALESADAVGDNLLKAGDGTTVFDGSTYDYILFSDGLFYQIGVGSVPVGKAYLHCDSNPNPDPTAPGLSIEFGDGSTGIENVNRETITNNRYFNLAGQRVAQPTKGLYIVNGKKVIVK